MRRLFVTGIGTDIGKTVVSAVLTEALEADYWKPVQCGELDNSDTMRVKNLTSNGNSTFHEETFKLKGFMSPHAAAVLENVNIDLDSINLPDTVNNIIIEGAGGLMVPLNNRELVIDMISHLNAEAVIVSQNYLGSINHTILTIDALKARSIPILGIVFNGEENSATEKVILEYSGVEYLGRVNQEEDINKETILKYKSEFSSIV